MNKSDVPVSARILRRVLAIEAQIELLTKEGTDRSRVSQLKASRKAHIADLIDVLNKEASLERSSTSYGFNDVEEWIASNKETAS